MSTKYEDANLILRLYELRREEVMRKARRWFIGFTPESTEDFQKVFADPESSAYFRMVTSYWDMAASFVNNGAIDTQMFHDANLEHFAVMSKVEPFLPQLRQMWNMPRYLGHLEKLVMGVPDAKERLAQIRERMKARQQQQQAARPEASQASAS